MIRKLRIKFVAINMSIVVIMLCIILGLVYFFTGASLEKQSIRMMKGVAARPFALRLPNEPGEDVRLPFFAIRLGPHGEQINVDGGYYDLPDNDALKALISRAAGSPGQVGIMPEYNLRFCHVQTPGGRYLVFADISSEMDTLHTLRNNLWMIGGISFVGFFLISVLLSGWAVRPVAKTFQKQQQFIAYASHELKTPLTVIITNAQLMETAAVQSPAGSGFAQNILIMSRQMKELIEQMLELARSESSENKRPRQQVMLSKVVENTLLPYEPLFFEKSLMLTSRIEAEIEVIGDQDKLRHVLEIILDNAQKYADPHSTVQVTLSRRKRRCVLTVSDQGQPLTQDQLENMFTRFYRADEARCSNGSYGLGLAIAQSIVKTHKGRIWITSEQGINTCHVELPCLQ